MALEDQVPAVTQVEHDRALREIKHLKALVEFQSGVLKTAMVAVDVLSRRAEARRRARDALKALKAVTDAEINELYRTMKGGK